MSDNYKVYRVFIASPQDVQKEREIFKEVIEDVNDIKAHSMGIHLEAIGWEDTLPCKARPQEIINKDIQRSHYVVMLLWKRWGSPSGKYSSGFEEEYHIADALTKTDKVRDIALYFRSIPDCMLEDPGEQLKNVLAFKEKIEKEKKFLYRPYEDEKTWEKFIRARLCEWLDELGGGGVKAASEPESLKVELPAELVRGISDTLVKEAVKKAENGEITKAEEYFIKATSLSSDTQALNLYAQFLYRIGFLDKAEEKLREVEYIGKKTDDLEILALSYANLGILYKTRGDLDVAQEMYEKSLAINIELGSKEGMANVYCNLGNVYNLRGDLHEAEVMQEKSLAIMEELGSKEGMASAYGNLGILYKTRGYLDRAEEMQEKSLAINKELGLKEGMASAYCNLGIVYQIRGGLDKAEEMYAKSLAIYKGLGRRECMASTYGNLGNLYKIRGDLERAEEMYEKSLVINKKLDRKDGMAGDYYNLGFLYITCGDFEKAEEMHEKSLDCFTFLGNKLMIQKVSTSLEELRKKK